MGRSRSAGVWPTRPHPDAITKTLVAPFSVRPRRAPGGPLSVAIGWDELDTDLRPDRWTIRMIGEQLADVGGPSPR